MYIPTDKNVILLFELNLLHFVQVLFDHKYAGHLQIYLYHEINSNYSETVSKFYLALRHNLVLN